MAAIPPVCDFGWKAVEFNLPATSGEMISLAQSRGENGTLVMFICNHCPYVLSILDRIIRDARELSDLGIGVVAISANDALTYPQDSFENMARLSEERGFPFPYLYDETQAIARAYDAACTPDFFGLNSKGELQYRGRLDDAKMGTAENRMPELRDAMTQIAKTGIGPAMQTPSMGCSIKWR